MSIKKESGDNRRFSTGASKQASAGKGTPALFPGDGYMEICKHFEAGAVLHGANNWTKGIPLSELINSLERHIASEKMGKTDERHDRAIAWNALIYLTTKLRIANGLLPTELDDLPKCQQRLSDKLAKKFIDTYLGPVEIAKALCKSSEPEQTRVYMCHSIRGKKGTSATQQEMIDNNNKAIEAGEYLRQEHPEFDVYVPGDHDEFIMIGYGNGTLSEKQILDIDCKIVERCDAIIMYTEDGYLSRGMVTEIKYAEKHKKRIWWYDGDKLWSSYCFAHMYPEEWKKVH